MMQRSSGQSILAISSASLGDALALLIIALSFVVAGLLGLAAAITFVVVAFWSWRPKRPVRARRERVEASRWLTTTSTWWCPSTNGSRSDCPVS
jgi:uncharacterized membrane protein YbhN (UPF0104 family)